MTRTRFLPELHDRLHWLKRFQGLIASHADELIEIMGQEVHKPSFEAISSEVLPLLSACKWHEKHAARLLRDRRIPGKPVWMLGVRHRLCRRPLGRVAIIATWNYPVQLLGIQLMQALVPGNRVIVKPSERSPRSQAMLLGLARDAGLTADELVWTEPTREAGATLIESEPFDHLLFTGSTAVGRRIAESLAPRLIPSTLELSGNDTAVVLESANITLAARSIWYAFTLNHGQTCMAPRRVLVADAVYDQFLEAIRAEVAKAEPRRLIDDAATESCRRVVHHAIAAGGRLISGDPDAPILEPIVVAECPEESALYRGEHFGPLLAVERLAGASGSFSERLTCPLTGSVFGSPAEAGAFAVRSPAGTVFINDAVVPTGHPGAPLGASGESGWGVSRGVSGLLAMTKPVTVSVTHPRFRLPLEPPEVPTSKMTPWLRRLYAGKAGTRLTEDRVR